MTNNLQISIDKYGDFSVFLGLSDLSLSSVAQKIYESEAISNKDWFSSSANTDFNNKTFSWVYGTHSKTGLE